MNRIKVMPPQAALWTFEADFARLKQCARQVEEYVTPKIMMTTEIMRPRLPGNVMSPNPALALVDDRLDLPPDLAGRPDDRSHRRVPPCR